jgi:S-(hydroxymethyl)glutathione dehydrogenase/alcohol dehydrogenase
MRAAVLYEVGRPLQIEEVELAGPGPHEVLVRIVASGVCHSDLHVVEGVLPHPMPVVLGHEAAGIVEEVGPGVTSLRPGDHVVISVVPVCGRCRFCLRGRTNLCTGIRTAPGVMADGTRRLRRGDVEINHFSLISSFAEYVVAHEGAAIKVREDAPLEKVCLVGCGVLTGVGAALNRARVEPGSSCVVVGCGGVGLSVIQGCVLAGATTIVAIDIVASKLEAARRLGATHTVDASREDAVAIVREVTQGGADYAFEVVGKQESAELALSCLARGGTLVLVGVGPREARLSIPITLTVLNERAVLGCDYGSARQWRDIPLLVDLYMAGRLRLDELVSGVYALDDVNQALDDLKTGKAIRPVLVP